jgi:hypothetical protein
MLTEDSPFACLLGWRTFTLPGEVDSVKACALLDRAGELEGTSDVPKGAGLEGSHEAR